MDDLLILLDACFLNFVYLVEVGLGGVIVVVNFVPILKILIFMLF